MDFSGSVAPAAFHSAIARDADHPSGSVSPQLIASKLIRDLGATLR